jgi:hypothetical protein
MHDTSFDHLEVLVPLTKNPVLEETSIGSCNYEFRLYPSKKFEEETTDNVPIIATVTAAAVFLAISLAFLMYSYFVAKRNSKIVDAAAKSNAIVLSLFPAHVRDKLVTMQNWGDMNKPKDRPKNNFAESNGSIDSETFLDGPTETIAELFPSASGKCILL